jgi:hypothetical protein
VTKKGTPAVLSIADVGRQKESMHGVQTRFPNPRQLAPFEGCFVENKDQWRTLDVYDALPKFSLPWERGTDSEENLRVLYGGDLDVGRRHRGVDHRGRTTAALELIMEVVAIPGFPVCIPAAFQPSSGKRVRRRGEFEPLGLDVPPPFVGGGPGHVGSSDRAHDRVREARLPPA